MQKQFEEYLQSKTYRPTTSIDYPARLERLCRKEKISYEHLAQHLAEIMPQYERTGNKSSYLSLNSLLKSKVKGLRFINSFVSAIK